MSTPTTFSPSNLSQEQLLHLWGTIFQSHNVIIDRLSVRILSLSPCDFDGYFFALSVTYSFNLSLIGIALIGLVGSYNSHFWTFLSEPRFVSGSVLFVIHLVCDPTPRNRTSPLTFTHISLLLICIHPPIPQIPPIHSGARSISRLTKRYTEGSEESSSSSNMSASALANGANSNIRTGAGTKPKVPFNFPFQD